MPTPLQALICLRLDSEGSLGFEARSIWPRRIQREFPGLFGVGAGNPGDERTGADAGGGPNLHELRESV